MTFPNDSKWDLDRPWVGRIPVPIVPIVPLFSMFSEMKLAHLTLIELDEEVGGRGSKEGEFFSVWGERKDGQQQQIFCLKRVEVEMLY